MRHVKIHDIDAVRLLRDLTIDTAHVGIKALLNLLSNYANMYESPFMVYRAVV